MIIFLTIEKKQITIRARAEGDGIVGDLVRVIKPGDNFLNVPYETLKEAGNGKHKLEYEEEFNNILPVDDDMELPSMFKLSIGGYMGPSYSVELIEGQTLVYKTLGPGYSPTKSELINPTESQWNQFWNKIAEIDVWVWNTRYCDPNVMDGTSWVVSIEYGENIIESSGSNSFPDDFGKFLRAVSQLLNNKKFC